MNRWLGSSSDSDKQASKRNSRAARREIARQPVLSESDEEYGDCNTFAFFGGLDGTDNLDETSSESSSTTSSAAEAAAAAA